MMLRVLKAALGFFLSLRTAIWLLLALILLFVFGALLMPVMKEYQGMNSLPLLAWLRRSPLGATWWLWGSIGLLALLTANTVLCSAESVVKKLRREDWLLVVSPQVVHLGFAFIVLAHLLTAVGGGKGFVSAREGTRVMLPSGVVLRVNDIQVVKGPRGFPSDFRAEVEYLTAGGESLGKDRLGPNSPSFYRGLGVYLKDVRFGTARLEVSREPGAPWALAGGALFMAGTLALFVLKVRRER